MKKYLFATLFVVAAKAYSFDAVIIVLEAPLLKEPKLNSVVLQTLRKGARVYVPTEIGNLAPLPEYIQTYDRVGNTAYIPTKYIKIITNEVTENQMPIAYPDHDPTDYRLEEPIAKTYPFDDSPYLRANVALMMGNNLKSPFEYNSNLSGQKYSAESGVRLNITRKIVFDNYDRYYFGLYGALTTNNNSLEFQNNNSAQENRSTIHIGPIITYDVFRNSNYRLTLGTGFTYNYHKSTVKMTSAAGDSEDRLFSGYSFSPFLNSGLQLVDIFPQVDLISGADLMLYLPHSQKTSDEASISQLWGSNSTNRIASGFKPQASFFLGVQVKY